MSRKKEQGWGGYFGEEMRKEPKNPWDMVGMALRLVLKTIVFIIAMAIKIIRGLKRMKLRGRLRGKKQEVQPFAFSPQHAQQLAQAGNPVAVQPPMQYPQQQIPQQQMPMPQQQMPMPQQQMPMPQQPIDNVPMQPASAIQKLPIAAPFGDSMQIEMLNQIYGAISYIRQALVDTQRIIGNINGKINDIYQRLNTIEGVQPVPTTRKKFEKKK